MGWLTMPLASMNGHASAKSYLDDQFTFERVAEDGSTSGLKVLASACLLNRTYYAAAQQLRNGVGGDIFAIVCLVKWNPRDKEGYVFGYKDMDETMGPCESSCPEKILRLLTPTTNNYALAWRQRCTANLQKRSRKLDDGVRIRLPEAMPFTDGHVGSEFLVDKRGRRIILRDPSTGRPYRITGLMEREWSIVAQTKVHRTIFA